jgi:hypothetical protein
MAGRNKKKRKPGKQIAPRASAAAALLGLLQTIVQLAILVSWLIWRH